MASSILDWHNHGVDLKVELATAGTLVLGGLKTLEPFAAGGSNGAPLGWTLAVYNQPSDFTPINSTTNTPNNTWSVSIVTPTSWNANFKTYYIAKEYNVVQGKRYQLSVRFRTMDTKDKANVMVRVEYQRASDSSWQYLTGLSTTDSASDWTDVLLTTGAAPAGPGGQSRIRFMLGGSATGTVPAANNQNWGVQFTEAYWVDIDADTEPIVWRDVTCDVRGLAIRYGREKFTNRYDVSTLSVELNNSDGEYSYKQFHEFGLRPGRQVRVIATHDGITYPMAFHIIDSLNDGYDLDGRVISVWQCVDPTSLLADQTVSSGVNALRLSGPRQSELLDQVGYQLRKIDPGVSGWTYQPIKDSGRSIRDEAGLVGDSEGGSFFADREGYLVYKDRTWLTVDPDVNSVTANLLASDPDWLVAGIDGVPTQSDAPTVCVSTLQTDWSLARVINIVTLANAGGTAQEFIDADSLQAHGPHTYQRMDYLLYTDAYLPTRADDLMNGYADALLRVNSIAFSPGLSDDCWPWTLSVFLNWLVRVTYVNPDPKVPWGYVWVPHVQSIEHRITLDNWETTVALDQPVSFVDVLFTAFGWDAAYWDEGLWDQTEKRNAVWDHDYLWSTAAAKWGP